ncbi:hypothetical protein MBLNU13_g03176t1 [Cladosporium sp. NU13]
MPPPTSNIRAFVHWKEPSIYAGEDIECIITFRNVAAYPGQEPQEEDEPQTPYSNGFSRAPSAVASRRSSLAQSSVQASWAPSFSSSRQAPNGRGHRPALSLNVLSTSSRGGLPSAGLHSAPMPGRTPTSARPVKGHGRSLSIMSLGSEAPSEGRQAMPPPTNKRPTRGHTRSASLQVTSKPPPLPTPHITSGSGSFRQPSPLYESFTPTGARDESTSLQPPRRRPGTVSADFTPRGHRRSPSAMSGGMSPNFEFPPRQQPADERPMPQPSPPKLIRTHSNMHSSQNRGISPRRPEGWSGPMSNLHPISRVITESSAGGTPRSSGDFYSMSNHSDETLASELPYQSQTNGRFPANQLHSRQASRSMRTHDSAPAEPETLMMGHAQTMGHFTLDGSLVNAAPFEDVKRKGVQGGGGVVGVERSSKRASGMFGAFSWGNLGESIGGLLGNDDMSSIAQMKATASSKTVPLLSTPQSLLFVDLCLAPGESSSYHYSFALPRGLPPTYRGRAIKISYHISLGIQRPGGQPVKQIEIPFRVLGSVNSRGEVLGHDLMSPYIMLKDSARTKSISAPASSPGAFPAFPDKVDKKAKPAKQGLEDFLRYTERLLASPMDANGVLLSPTSPTSPVSPVLSPSTPRRQSHGEPQPTTTKEVIDFAILRSNQTSQPGMSQSSNRFNIARSGQPVAVLTLLRPAYRLGETIIGTIDFTMPPTSRDDSDQASTYSVNLELESAERVDPSLALRSGSSIQRVTRKVHASMRENSLFARSLSFSLAIPAHATPTFETTGVSLLWRLRVEFTTERQPAQISWPEDDDHENSQELLEEIGRDERGANLLARERLMAETFEIAVPLRIYGAQGVDGLGGDPDPLII